MHTTVTRKLSGVLCVFVRRFIIHTNTPKGIATEIFIYRQKTSTSICLLVFLELDLFLEFDILILAWYCTAFRSGCVCIGGLIVIAGTYKLIA
jgi:hypothetical protein